MALKYLVLMVLMFGPTAWAQFKTLNDHLEKMCVRNGVPNVFEKIEKASNEFRVCTHGLQDMEIYQFQNIKNDDVYTDLDVYNMIFKEYCPRIEKATECLDVELKGLSICFNEMQKEDIKNLDNVIKQTVKFICHDHADRIRLFVIEGGLECIKTIFEEKEKQTQCFSKLKVAKSNDALNRMIESPFGDEQCDDYKKLQECIVDPMKSCKSSTPADLVESLFEEAFKGTPCDNSMSPCIIVLITVIVLAIVVLVIVVAYKERVCC